MRRPSGRWRCPAARTPCSNPALNKTVATPTSQTLTIAVSFLGSDTTSPGECRTGSFFLEAHAGPSVLQAGSRAGSKARGRRATDAIIQATYLAAAENLGCSFLVRSKPPRFRPSARRVGRVNQDHAVSLEYQSSHCPRKCQTRARTETRQGSSEAHRGPMAAHTGFLRAGRPERHMLPATPEPEASPERVGKRHWEDDHPRLPVDPRPLSTTAEF